MEISPVTKERAFSADAPPLCRTRLDRNGFAISTILRVIYVEISLPHA